MTTDDTDELLAALPEAALILDVEGRIRTGNALARALLAPATGGSPFEGRALPSLLAFDARGQELLSQLPAGHRLAALEADVEQDQGQPFARRVVVLVGAARPGPQGLARLALVRDVTEERRKEQLRITHEKLAAISQLAAGVAHEFNNIMASLFGFAQLAEQDPSFTDELIGAIGQYAERSRDITRRLRSFSPEQSGPLESVAFADILESVIERLSPEFAAADVKVERRYDPVPEALASRRELEEAFETILVNAKNAIVKGGRISVELAVEEKWIRIRVADTGYGLPKEHLTRVFEPFFTLKQTSDHVRPGGGLGLAVAYNYVRRHGGEIFAESELGKGTVFTIRLPLRVERRRREGASGGTQTERRRLGERAQRTILAVDDEEGMVRLLESILADHKVTTARSGREAITAVQKRGPFDYVILDLILPGELDGYAVFDEIAKRQQGAKVILLTGLVEDDRVKEYAARAYGYLRKPFGIKDLSTLIV